MTKQVFGEKGKKERRFPLIWNFRTEPGTETVTYYFLILNQDSREIDDITERLVKLVSPCTPQKGLNDNISGTSYSFLEIESYNVRPDVTEMSKVYGGRLNIEKRLYPRENDYGLENFVVKRVKEELEKPHSSETF